MRKSELDRVVGLYRPPEERAAPNMPHVVSMEGMFAPATAKVPVRGVDLWHTQVTA
jgi:hypothetical protein